MNAGAPSPKIEEQLLPGTQLIVRRRAYFHHGIYVGRGKVIHYAGWFHSARGLIEEVALEQFTEGRPYSIGRTPADRDKGKQIVRRVRSRLGEKSYQQPRSTSAPGNFVRMGHEDASLAGSRLPQSRHFLDTLSRSLTVGLGSKS